MRRLVPFFALLLAVAACGDDEKKPSGEGGSAVGGSGGAGDGGTIGEGGRGGDDGEGGDPGTGGSAGEGGEGGGGGTAGEGGEGGSESRIAQIHVSVDGFCIMCNVLRVGDGRALQATAYDALDQVIDDVEFEWTSTDETVATVSETGEVLAVGAGEAAIEASAEGVSGSFAVIVEPMRIARIEILTDEQVLTVGGTAQFEAIAYNEQDEVVPNADIRWYVPNPLVASIDETSGLATADGPGKTVVTAWTPDGFAVEDWQRLEVEGDVGTGWVFVELGLGSSHSCGLDAFGKAFCWGNNFWGQLGNGTRSERDEFFPTPIAVAGPADRPELPLTFTALTVGGDLSCALAEDSSAWCWGDLGSTLPIRVAPDLTFQQLSTSGSHTCGITSAAEIYCWGANHAGQLGAGSDEWRIDEPTRVVGEQVWESVHAGMDVTCALTTAGEAWCWGEDDMGELGNGEPLESTNEPSLVAGGHVFESLDITASIACGIDVAGNGLCWGRNDLGVQGPGGHVHTPTEVPGEFVAISAATFHACGIDTTGVGYCWGVNVNGRLGNGTAGEEGDPQLPVALDTDLRFTRLWQNNATGCAVTADDHAYCWGNSSAGQIGGGFSGGAGSFTGGSAYSVVPWPVSEPDWDWVPPPTEG